MVALFLIGHKVRGEAAFDVAVKCTCSECQELGCAECDGQGYWWVIPTSGHRAYPFWHGDLIDMIDSGTGCHVMEGYLGELCKNMPEDLPDHYQSRAAPREDRLAGLLAMLPPIPSKPWKRRF